MMKTGADEPGTLVGICSYIVVYSSRVHRLPARKKRPACTTRLIWVASRVREMVRYGTNLLPAQATVHALGDPP